MILRRCVAALALLLSGCAMDPLLEAARRPRTGGTDVTFFVAADAHLGAEGMAESNRAMISDMNRLPGTEYPPSAFQHPMDLVGVLSIPADPSRLEKLLTPLPERGRKVARPLGVLFAGDMTDHGLAGEWRQWEQLYGRTGKEGLLRYPSFECTGNHDRILPLLESVPGKVRGRHGSLNRSWDWDEVHLMCLDTCPRGGDLAWLRRDLAANGRERPAVIYFHYSVLGPFSDWWSDSEKDAFAKAIEGFNVIAIFHGHFHGSYSYTWNGYDVFNIGSPMYVRRFLVVHVTDTSMTVAAWDWEAHGWAWAVTRAINQ